MGIRRSHNSGHDDGHGSEVQVDQGKIGESENDEMTSQRRVRSKCAPFFHLPIWYSGVTKGIAHYR
jgi:hypothetical protein